jgi:hypothetical protein
MDAWPSTPTNQSTCEAARYEIALYSKGLCVGLGCNPWHIENAKYHGTWVSSELIGDHCEFRLDAGYSIPYFAYGTFYSQWRMAGRAYIHGTFDLAQPVKLGRVTRPG